MAFEFLAVKQGGIDFSRRIINIHPELEKIREIDKEDEKKREAISNYFDLFYEQHGDYLKRKKVEFNKEWKEVEDEFLDVTGKIFKGYPFPRGKYVGYLSIIDCNPRFLEDKTFQIYYLHRYGVRYVTAHELLHFIFYDYAEKKYPELFKELDTEGGSFWDLAEIFNSIILHTPSFIKIHGIKEKVVYPEHLKYLPELDKIWREYQDIDKFIVKAYRLLEIRTSS